MLLALLVWVNDNHEYMCREVVIISRCMAVGYAFTALPRAKPRQPESRIMHALNLYRAMTPSRI